MTDLKPCPFCGGEAKHYHHTPAGIIMSADHIECDDCSNGTCLHETKADAVTAWNTRVDDRVSTTNPVVDHEMGNMSDKLRDVSKVAHEVCEEMEEYGPSFAAKVIEALRARAQIEGQEA